MKQNTTKTAKTIDSAKKDLTTINLDKFSDQLEKLDLKEKKERETIYIYPEGFDKTAIGSEKGKKFRNGLRNQMKRISNNILLFAKMKRNDDLIAEIAKFEDFYKTNYRTQDYTLASISQSNNETKEADLTLMLQIVKEIKSAK